MGIANVIASMLDYNGLSIPRGRYCVNLWRGLWVEIGVVYSPSFDIQITPKSSDQDSMRL